MNTRSTWPIAARCSGRRLVWRKSPKCAIRTPSRLNTKIVLGPRAVPAASSCSDAIAMTVADRRLEPPGGRADDMRVAGDRLDRGVVAMLVGHEQDVGGMGLVGG